MTTSCCMLFSFSPFLNVFLSSLALHYYTRRRCVLETLVGDIGTYSNSTTEKLLNSASVQKQVKR